MLALVFQVGPERVALDVRRVKEVVPRVRLQPLAGGPPWLAGTFVYRGQVVPVIDLVRLVGAGDGPLHLSSRIILVPPPGEDPGGLVGLLAAGVCDLEEIEPPPAPAGGFDLGPVVAQGAAVLHVLDLDRLLTAERRGLLAGACAGGPP